MNNKVPVAELKSRMDRFRSEMEGANPGWETAIIFGKINLYYFTGTMQDGMLLIRRDSEAVLWVRRSYERAVDESMFSDIRPMKSFRDAVASVSGLSDTVYMETEIVPLALFQRLQKHFPFSRAQSLDRCIASVRSVKSVYELELMRQAGKIHRRVLEDLVPGMLEEGMSEASFATRLFSTMVEEGHYGIARFSMFETEVVLGSVCFGESSIYPTAFDGPGGNYGMSPAVPLLGSRERKLRKGDMVFVDIGCCVDGYNTDKTMTYMFGRPLPSEVISAHNKCVEIQHRAAAMLKPGAIPEHIYGSIMESLDNEFLENFMGFGSRRVKFIGHGVGLHIDEFPVIAEGFLQPLKEGMVFAIEPKKGIKDVGMVGIENTFIVTPDGGESITGDSRGMIPVY